MQAVLYFVKYLVFPGFLFSAVVGLLTTWVDRKVSARVQLRVKIPSGADNGTTLRIHTEAPFRGALRIYGSAVTAVLVNGSSRTITREGDVVVLAADRLVYLPLVMHSFR